VNGGEGLELLKTDRQSIFMTFNKIKRSAFN